MLSPSLDDGSGLAAPYVGRQACSRSSEPTWRQPRARRPRTASAPRVHGHRDGGGLRPRVLRLADPDEHAARGAGDQPAAGSARREARRYPPTGHHRPACGGDPDGRSSPPRQGPGRPEAAAPRPSDAAVPAPVRGPRHRRRAPHRGPGLAARDGRGRGLHRRQGSGRPRRCGVGAARRRRPSRRRDLVHGGRGQPLVGPGEVRSPVGAHRARRRARAGRSGRGPDRRPRGARHPRASTRSTATSPGTCPSSSSRSSCPWSCWSRCSARTGSRPPSSPSRCRSSPCSWCSSG